MTAPQDPAAPSEPPKLAITKDADLEEIETELRARHAAQRSTGIIMLPPMRPKPVPPPEFWTQEADTMTAPRLTEVEIAAQRIRAMMRARKFGSPPPTFEGSHGEGPAGSHGVGEADW
jgi:hypothetical protein